MGLLDFIKSKIKPKKRKVRNSITPPRSFVLGDDFYRIDATNNELKLSAVYAAITTISSTMSKIPFFIIDSKIKKRKYISNIDKLLNDVPNSRYNACVMNEMITKWILIDGEAFVLPIRRYRSNEIEKRIPFRKYDVTIKLDNKNYETYYELTFPDKHKELHSAGEVEHYVWETYDGVSGISPLDHARNIIQSGLNQDRYNQHVFQAGCRPKDYIKIDADLPYDSVKYFVGVDEKGNPVEEIIPRREAIRREWEKTGGRTAILDKGGSYNTITPISPEQMQFVTSKDVTAQDVARFFHMGSCMFKLGVGKQTYNTNEQGQICYINETILPILRQWEKELTLKLLTSEQREQGWEIKCNINAELRGDTSARLAWYKGMHEMGVYNINEIRDYEDLSSIGDDGDIRTIGPNAVPLERAINGESAAEVTPNNVNGEDPIEEQSNEDAA